MLGGQMRNKTSVEGGGKLEGFAGKVKEKNACVYLF
jgi:hypothetical protein